MSSRRQTKHSVPILGGTFEWIEGKRKRETTATGGGVDNAAADILQRVHQQYLDNFLDSANTVFSTVTEKKEHLKFDKITIFRTIEHRISKTLMDNLIFISNKGIKLISKTIYTKEVLRYHLNNPLAYIRSGAYDSYGVFWNKKKKGQTDVGDDENLINFGWFETYRILDKPPKQYTFSELWPVLDNRWKRQYEYKVGKIACCYANGLYVHDTEDKHVGRWRCSNIGFIDKMVKGNKDIFVRKYLKERWLNGDISNIQPPLDDENVNNEMQVYWDALKRDGKIAALESKEDWEESASGIKKRKEIRDKLTNEQWHTLWGDEKDAMMNQFNITRFDRYFPEKFATVQIGDKQRVRRIFAQLPKNHPFWVPMCRTCSRLFDPTKDNKNYLFPRVHVRRDDKIILFNADSGRKGKRNQSLEQHITLK